jgi:hypothetical protein
MRHLAQRIQMLTQLNEINKLAEDLAERITHADDWLFLSNEQCRSEVTACLVKASECAALARQTLDALEERIRAGERAASRLRSVAEPR